MPAESDVGLAVPLRVLMVEDQPLDAELCVRELAKAGYEVHVDRVDSRDQFADRLASKEYDIVISDYGVPGWSGMDAFRLLKSKRVDVPFILVTGTLGEEAAVELMRGGLTDYILKDRLTRLPMAVRGALADREAREARRRAEERYQRLAQAVESSSELMCMSDSAGKITFANQAFLSALGYTEQELLGRSFGQFVLSSGNPSDLEKEFRSAISSKVCSKGEWVGECLFRRKTGADLAVHLTAGRVKDANGTVVGSFASAQDVTERKRTEEALRRLAAIVESSRDSIIGEELDGTIISWNAGAQRIYGYSAEEVIGDSAAILAPPERQNEAAEALARVKEGRRVEPFETVRVRKDGKRVHVALSLSEVKDASGRITGASVIARDITESKRLEEMFRQAQKMEAIGRLAGGIAHDFNNILGVIIGYSEMLLEKFDASSDLRKPVEEIKKAGDRASAMTRQLLVYSRQQIVERRVVNLNQSVTEMENMLRRMIGEDVELRTILDPVLGRVKADPGQIQQAIMNLAVNARDAMPRGGTIILETANVELDERYGSDATKPVSGPYAMLAVTDTGMGMDADTQARIFEPFFTTKEQNKGTGLGLSSVYGVVNQSGGHIRVYSELGQGTVFKIYLPRVDEEAPQSARHPGEERSYRGSETVLLVEDEESLRSLTRQFLEQSGYHVIEAAHGSNALEVVQGHRGPIHLLLSDVVMPGMSGPALAAMLAPLHPETKVLYVSGYTGGFAVHNGLLDAAMRLLQKPFSRDALLKKVRQALDADV